MMQDFWGPYQCGMWAVSPRCRGNTIRTRSTGKNILEVEAQLNIFSVSVQCFLCSSSRPRTIFFSPLVIITFLWSSSHHFYIWLSFFLFVDFGVLFAKWRVTNSRVMSWSIFQPWSLDHPWASKYIKELSSLCSALRGNRLPGAWRPSLDPVVIPRIYGDSSD